MHVMKNVLLTISLLAACVGSSDDAIPLDAAADAPTCELCNGPGCEDLDAACMSVESASRAIVCDEMAVDAPNEFSTVTSDGRIARCRCDSESCSPFPACSTIDAKCADLASISRTCLEVDLCSCTTGPKGATTTVRCEWDGGQR